MHGTGYIDTRGRGVPIMRCQPYYAYDNSTRSEIRRSGRSFYSSTRVSTRGFLSSPYGSFRPTLAAVYQDRNTAICINLGPTLNSITVAFFQFCRGEIFLTRLLERVARCDFNQTGDKSQPSRRRPFVSPRSFLHTRSKRASFSPRISARFVLPASRDMTCQICNTGCVMGDARKKPGIMETVTVGG